MEPSLKSQSLALVCEMSDESKPKGTAMEPVKNNSTKPTLIISMEYKSLEEDNTQHPIQLV